MVTGLLFFVLALVIFVLLLLTLSPVCVDTVFRSSVFPASVGDCGTGGPGHLQNPSLPTVSKASTGYHFFLFSVGLVIVQYSISDSVITAFNSVSLSRLSSAFS